MPTPRQRASLFGAARDYKDVLPSQRVLVALLKEPSDWETVQEQGWYRIPQKSAPPANYGFLAFYCGSKAFGADAWQIKHWARVAKQQTVRRRDLFPEAFAHPRADELYQKISVADLQALPRPIVSRRARFLVFLQTTLSKLHAAEELNDLWHESPLEDAMWDGFKRENIEAERQWRLTAGRQNYCLDFAVFCARGGVNVECDGDSYHTSAESSRHDNARNNALTSQGWAVLRFNTQQITQELGACLQEVRATVSSRGGIALLDGGLRFPATGGEDGKQMSLF